MFIQVIGYRSKVNKTTGKEYDTQVHFDNIEITSVEAIFNKTDAILEKVPADERFDLHYTNAFCDPKQKARTFGYQEMLVFDIDEIEADDLENRKQEYIQVVCQELGIKPEKTATVFSGHGLHFIVKVKRFDKITESLKKQYSTLCNELTVALFNNGLTGKVDPVRLMNAATLRFPNTENRKDPSSPVMSYILQGNIEEQVVNRIIFDESEASKQEVKHDSVMPIGVDTKSVLSGCEFIRWAGENQSDVTEPQWTALIGTLAYVPNVGDSLCHNYSKNHDGYNSVATDAKIARAKDFGKPRTCDSIAQIFPGCAHCPYRGKVKTPLAIKGEDYIRTKDTGFHIITDKGGLVPDYEGLVKYFRQTYRYIVLDETKEIFIFNGKHWENIPDSRIDEFANVNFKPQARNGMRSEFKGFIQTSNLVKQKFFAEDIAGYINFNNGVLRLNGRELLPHSDSFGFKYVLPYDYNPTATAPEFVKMLNNITLNDKGLQAMLLEYVGYAISGVRASLGSKALILTGTGSNGKSTFLDIIKMCIGHDSFSTVSIKDLSDANSRYALVGKLMNICEEVDPDELLKSGTASFKSIVTGAEMQVKKLYLDKVSMRIDTKLLLSCNELPAAKENNDAIYRRLLIVPFNARFTGRDKDKGILSRVAKEMSGVYNMILDAHDRLEKNNYEFTEAKASIEMLNEYKNDNSVFNRFAEDMLDQCDENNPDCILTSDLIVAYNTWAMNNNETYRPTSQRLIKALRAVGFVEQPSKVKKLANGVVVRYLPGIKRKNALGY